MIAALRVIRLTGMTIKIIKITVKIDAEEVEST